MALEIVGAGLGRTGTRSLKDALERLGFVRTYHMVELIGDLSRLAHWEDAHAGRDVDWETLFDGYQATVDYPGALYWRALVAKYPEAKVILTVRDPEAWYRSARRTIFQVSMRGGSGDPLSARHRAFVNEAVWEDQFEGRFEEQTYAIARFHEHNEAVIREVPADRLLVYDVAEGWEPLCAFLGVPVPEAPFPWRNTSEEFVARLRARDAS